MKKQYLFLIPAVALFLSGCGAPAATPSLTAYRSASATASPSPNPAVSVTAGTTKPTAGTVIEPRQITLTDEKGKHVRVFLGMRSAAAGTLIQNAHFSNYTDTGDAGSETIANNTFCLTFMPHTEGAEYTLCSIAFTSKEYATVAGLRLGDSTARMKELYGLRYVQYDPSDYASENPGENPVICCQYAMDSHFLNVMIKEGAVVRWSVERYDFDEYSRRLVPPGMPGSYWN